MSIRDIFSYVARQVFFDNSANGFVADNVQEAIEETKVSASPGFGFGRSGNSASNTWLLRTGSVPSNKTGVSLGISNPQLKQIDVSNENISTFDIAIYEHEGDEINLTLLTTVSITGSRTASFTVSDFGTVDATQGRQLAVRIVNGSARNLGVDVTLIGQSG
jgi:hypothetical protein